MNAFYLAGRYGRRLELRECAADLLTCGHVITASWLTKEPEWEDDGLKLGDTATINAHVALTDTADIDACDTLIGFTDEPDCPFNRGGKDREIGYAMGRGKRVLLCGPVQTCFDLHPIVTRFDDWQSCLAFIKEHELAAAR